MRDTLRLPVTEFSAAEYPEDPAERSIMHGRYRGRSLTLLKKDTQHFDFVLEAQQVSFTPDSPHLEVSGGDDIERTNLFTAELAKNCLNAGLWEIQLTMQEGGHKALYTQAWFTFPLGHYRKLVEMNSGITYSRFWRHLEHWVNPEGVGLDLTQLRTVVSEQDAKASSLKDERVFADGEQNAKGSSTSSTLNEWGLRNSLAYLIRDG
ncbi:MAG: hypothetical protein EXR86_07400 [Gammaproteobacteria bacterium]|nr:hypothetical protein [Gammaproteobacteria bacterium]